ncbi:MAG: hypothetical protein ABSE28_07915 [Candidatus Sulfotelmatobacter sp.]|jgi:hypothetical protein
MRSAILLLHIIAGTLGMLSGFVAVFLRKGSRQHGVAGNVFVVAMLGLSASGVYLAVMKSQPGNILGATLTFYLVATAWMTAWRRDGEPGILDWGALLVASAVAAVDVTWGFEAAISPTGLKHDYPPGPYFFLGSVALLAATGDVRMLVRNRISGTQRIARHLWRMCFALFIAAASIFLARQQIFPSFLRKTGALFVLSFLPLILMIFWLVRVRFLNAYQKRAPVVGGPHWRYVETRLIRRRV